MSITYSPGPPATTPTAPVAAPAPPQPIPRTPPRPAWYRRSLPAMLAMALTGLVLYVIVYQALISTGNPVYVPALIVVGASTVPAAFALYVSQLAGTVHVSARMLAMSALWGGVLGGVVAGVLEADTSRALGGLPSPLIGLIEESAKLLVPLVVLLFARRLHHHEGDGLLIGVAVGVGFSVLETMGYAFVALLQTRGNLHAMDQLLLIRGLLAPAGHAAWTGLAAAALWRFGIRRTLRSAFGFLATFGLVVALHALWDAVAGWPWYLGLAAVSLGLLHLRLWRSRRAARIGRYGAPPAAGTMRTVGIPATATPIPAGYAYPGPSPTGYAYPDLNPAGHASPGA